MAVDINDRVLAAFQVEHKEQLEAIRALLAQLDEAHPQDARAQIDEAFRMAHSLKGGARACNLRPAEMLGHGLENVFAQVREGTLRLDEGVTATICVVLDAIEDWMAAVERDEAPEDPQEALAAIQCLAEAENAARPPTGSQDDGAQQVVQAFQAECPQYVAALRQLGAMIEDPRAEVTADDLEDAYRLAHNLRGSSQAAEVMAVEQLGEQLETLIASMRDAAAQLDESGVAKLRQLLDGVDREMESLSPDAPPSAADSRIELHSMRDAGRRIAAAADDDGAAAEAAKTAKLHQADTVRVSTEGLDRLLRSSRQLLTESLRLEQVSRGLDELRRQVNEMERERESIRRFAAASLHRLTTMPEFTRLARYFDSVDRRLQSLARCTRQLTLTQKRSSWMLQSVSRRVQQDVRHTRMVPAETIFQGFRKMVRDLAREEGKQIEFRAAGLDVRADRMVLQALKDPLIHMLRNCVGHGIESPDERAAAGKNISGNICLGMETAGNRLNIEVHDDGRGIEYKKIAAGAVQRGLLSEADAAQQAPEDIAKLIFEPGFTTSDKVTEIAGRGMGLSVVQQTATRLQGEVAVHQKEGPGTTIRVSVPLSVSTHRLLLVSAADHTYAIPVHGIARLLRLKVKDLETVEGKPIVTFNDQPVPLVRLSNALGLENERLPASGEPLQVVIVKSATRHLALSVESFLAERDLLIQDLDGAAAHDKYLGAVILEGGDVALVLNPSALLDGSHCVRQACPVGDAAAEIHVRVSRVLVVDDSFTTRTLEKSILEAHGYQVGIAVDGVEALNQLKCEKYDLVISDVEMPRMDGFTLLGEIKKDRRLAATPVILVTSRDRPEDQERGLELGADAYIVKRKFDHQELLNTIRQIV